MDPRRCLLYVRQHWPRFIHELRQFTRFPSISAQPDHAHHVRSCAKWLAGHLRQIGLNDVKVVSTERHPVVLASHHVGLTAPTLLIYGHYDVQPVDPLTAWRVAPFAATIADGYLFGRGSSDDKGQLFAHVKALESWLRTQHRVPVNIKCVFEGEEEIGSPNLLPFLDSNRKSLQANAVVISDMAIASPDQPAITCALRGALTFELSVTGPAHDLHSGQYGGAVLNPAQAWCDILSSLHDPRGRIAIRSFYRDVRTWAGSTLGYMKQHGPSESEIQRRAGTRMLWGESDMTAYERLTIRPSLTIAGMQAGYNGPGFKGVIPSRASVKLGFRLVPDQDPNEVERLFRAHIRAVSPPQVRVDIERMSAARPVVLDPRTPPMKAAAAAYRHVFGKSPILLRSGGTVPVVEYFARNWQLPVVLMGFASPDDRAHGFNERFFLRNFQRGIATSIFFMHHLANISWRPQTISITRPTMRHKSSSDILSPYL
jgi:acetylornithine deacetylase/succinyl-diaminopimelate desuccinylase-like protein